MRAARYVFQTLWRVPVPPEQAFDVLRALDDYPAWWPEVKEIRRLGADRAAAVCRSILPYELRFELVRTVEDPAELTLETRLHGDLEGFTRWTITPADGRGSRCTFDEDVVTNKRSLNALAPIARPGFRLNHWVMMRNGRKGLTKYLATRGRTDA